MKQNDSTYNRTNEDRTMKSRMEQMVNSYDSYMRTMTLGRERTLREMTVNLAQQRSIAFSNRRDDCLCWISLCPPSLCPE